MIGLVAALLLVLVLILLVHNVLPQLLCYWRYRKAVDKLPKMYGHIPFFGVAFQLIGPMNQFLDTIGKLLKKSKSPSVLALGPVPFLILVEPEQIEVILSSSKHIKKTPEYRFAKPWVGEGLVVSSEPRWSADRKMLAPTFHLKILETFLHEFIDKSKMLVIDLEKEVGSTSFNVFPYIAKRVMDIVCATVMGITTQQQDIQARCTDVMFKISEELTYRGIRPWLHPDIIYKFSSSGRRLSKCTKILHGISREILQERKEQYRQNTAVTVTEDNMAFGKRNRLAFLDYLLINKEAGLLKLTDEDIREQVDTFMFAAHDTGTSVLSWALQMLGSYPEIQEKAFQEQEEMFEGSTRAPNMKDLNEMKYLERCIKETLRLYPGIPFYGRQLEEDVKIGDHVIPSGMRILIFAYHTHRLERYFPNPNEFDPDRFLPERSANLHPFAFIPFSAGPRNCIGWKFAMIEAKAMLSIIIRHYKFQATGGIPKPVPELVIRPENGVHVKIIKRK